ncbi:ParB/RepB/Spo0J family partition protein [Streptomyces sp. NPDC098077]|uniref:ParB/RepB/Spo0J family partition protein n=1 Tax=Streptomyces sp. NPDC098077 TaxID=3366093 RepID=UPI0037F4D71F
MSEVTEIPISEIQVAGSLRTKGEDLRHIDALAEVWRSLPPVVIHRQTMAVIDGVHRLRALERSGVTRVKAVFFDGDDREAFVLAVKLNAGHGLPLSLADRKAAARRMLADFPEWSNRRLAEATGLSDKTVGTLRSRAEIPHPASVRLGRDGVAYPVAAAEGRSRSLAFLTVNPGASAREVALASGVSLTTAKDVIRQVRAAVQEQQAPDARAGGGTVTERPKERPGAEELAHAVRRLRADPSLRFTEVGRKLLCMLGGSAAQPQDDWAEMASSLPIHCAPVIAELARHHAESWQLLAESLTERLNAGHAEE